MKQATLPCSSNLNGYATLQLPLHSKTSLLRKNTSMSSRELARNLWPSTISFLTAKQENWKHIPLRSRTWQKSQSAILFGLTCKTQSVRKSSLSNRGQITTTSWQSHPFWEVFILLQLHSRTLRKGSCGGRLKSEPIVPNHHRQLIWGHSFVKQLKLSCR